MVWLKFLPVLITAIIAIIDQVVFLKEKPKRGQKPKRKLPVFKIILTVICACFAWWSFYADDKFAKESRAREENWRTNTTFEITKMNARRGDEDAMTRFLNNVKAANARFNAETVPVKAFLANEPARIAAREETQRINKIALTNHLVRIEPVHDLVLNRFDKWIGDLKSAGKKITIQTNRFSSVRLVTDDAAEGSGERTVTFENGSVGFSISQGIINEGSLSSIFRAELRCITPSYSGSFWAFEVNPTQYKVVKFNPRFSYQPYLGELVDPQADQDFINALKVSFDEVMEFMVGEAVMPRRTDAK